MPTPDHETQVRALLAELLELEHAGTAPTSTLSVGPYSGWIVAAALQWAWQQPGWTNDARQAIRRTAVEAHRLYTGELAACLERGWPLSTPQEPAAVPDAD